MAEKEPEHSTIFHVPGSELFSSLEKRAARHLGEINDCLDSISKILKEKAGTEYDDLLNTCVQAMLAIHHSEGMTAPTRVIKAQLERAAQLQNERIDLLTIARNIRKDRGYRLTVEEAKRYGMT